jgi:hypothetical protein
MIDRMNSEFSRATGKILCNNLPVKYARVKLMDSDPLWDEEFSESITSYDGSFYVSGHASDTIGGNPDPYLRVEYYYKGTYGEFIIQSGFWQTDCADETSEKSYAETLNFGTLNFNNEACRTYIKIYNAFEDFYNRALVKVPVYTDVIINSAVADVACPNVCSTTETIRIPSDKEISQSTSKHELAHIVRQQYDGDILHATYDTIKYGYGGDHDCPSKTNYGYAFQEGWAQYWENENKCGSYNGTDYTIEGNVASALRRLQSKCNTNWANMVRVLRIYPGSIHSFQEFNTKHYALYGCKL